MVAPATANGAEVVLPPLPVAVVLRTDAESALHTARVPLGLPFGVGLVRVEFTVGYATAERPAPGQFLDALSLSFEPPGTDETSWLLNSDARGDTWFPDDPEGPGFPSGVLAQRSIAFPGDLEAGWPLSSSFAVTLSLPVAWQNCEAGLWLDLFDNGTGGDSVMFLREIRLVARAPFFLLESSAHPGGPYSAEMGVGRDANRGEFELPRGGAARFFRLRADSTVSLRVLGGAADGWRFGYEFPEPQPMLESAARAAGPFTVEPLAVLDPGRREFRLKTSGLARFYRVRANVRTVVTRLVIQGGEAAVVFEYRPQVFSLQSSAQPCGPYADDPSAQFDTARQVITLSRTHFLRFFRVAHSSPGEAVRFRSVEDVGDRWRLRYEIGANERALTGEVQP